MKKISKFILGLCAVMAITSCSDNGASGPAVSTDIMVTVTACDNIDSRAIATIEGYELNCVMQLVNDAGAMVGTQTVKPASGGVVSFTIKAADIDEGASKALFWAEYVPTSGNQKVYNSADLTNITYNVTTFTNAAQIAASDAFAGAITTLTNGASVTLTRPMIQFNFTPNNPEIAQASTSLAVSYTAPSGYNVLTGNCTIASVQALNFANQEFSYNAYPWFTSYIFAPSNMSKLDQPITMTLSGGFEKEFVIKADEIPSNCSNSEP